MKYNYRHQNDGLQAEESDRTAAVPVGESLTVQSMTEDSDINVMMDRFGITAKMPDDVRFPDPSDFLDVSGVTDFRSAIEAVKEAEREFMKIPAAGRAFFGNDPQALVDFVANGGNMETLKAIAERKPLPVPVVESSKEPAK